MFAMNGFLFYPELKMVYEMQSNILFNLNLCKKVNKKNLKLLILLFLKFGIFIQQYKLKSNFKTYNCHKDQ